MIPFKGTKWDYTSSKTTTFPLGLGSTKSTNMSSSIMTSKKEANQITANESSDLMNKLELFSDVWNDCPTIDNPVLSSEKRFKEKRNSYNDNQVTQHNFMKKKAYNSSETNISQSNLHNGEQKRTKRNEHDLLKIQNASCHEKNDFSENNQNSKESDSRESNSDVNCSKRKKADLKRKKAAHDLQQLHVDQKNIIKQALSSLDGSNKVNKKIVFDNDEEDIEEPTELEETSLSAKRQKLFDDDDHDDSSKFDIDVDFKLNHKFEGKKGQKLLELQSKYSSDSRFALDKRFYESGSDGEDDTGKEPNTSDEKTKQLAILESIVKQQIRPLSEHKKRPGTRFDDKVLLRFDPTREDHVKYIITQPEPTKNQVIEKKKKKKDAVKTNTETIKPEVSKDKFVSVKENIKEVLNKDSGFSLLSLFGNKETDDIEESIGETEKVKKPKHAPRNPFKYDSSDSEPEEDAKVKKDTKQNIKTNKSFSWRTNFFFTENDPRFQEAFEFLKCPEKNENNSEYAAKRKVLKDFIKSKYKNSVRKNSSFKKKLGGLKKKPFVKRKVK